MQGLFAPEEGAILLKGRDRDDRVAHYAIFPSKASS
jgi:hypothetical protein